MKEPDKYEWKALALEMRRTAVNFFEQHGGRCEVDDECTCFATYFREGSWPQQSCDHHIDEARAAAKKAASKGHAEPEYVEVGSAAQIRELAAAVSAMSIPEDQDGAKQRETDGDCAVEGCDNGYDPRWFVHVGGVAYQACDGHGCASGAPCRECEARAMAAGDVQP